MFFETVRSDKLGHLSYIVGDAGRAAVIDPRRDCKVYVDIANRHNARITYIFETHRNEDYVIGSLELSRRTKAQILHGNALPFKYGKPVSDGNKFDFGNVTLKVIETPGHTPESISIVMIDKEFGGNPVAVFTGDTLFVGDVGRTDLFAEMKEKMASDLYDSIHKKLLPLGDYVTIYPAHSAGSVCGKNMASREFSTLGYERHFNPLLQLDRKTFIDYKAAEEHHYAPYFRQMEKYNQNGIPLVAKLPEPKPMDVQDFSEAIDKGDLLVLDIRSPEAFAGAHIPGSLSIPLDMISAFAGWFLPYDKPVGLVTERQEDVEKARIYLMRLGYDNVAYYIAGGLNTWSSAGFPFGHMEAIHVDEIERRIKDGKDFLVLDVRTNEEFKNKPGKQSQNIYLGNLPQHLKDLPREKKITTFCSSGRRAVIAASLLRQTGLFDDVEVCLGSAMPEKMLAKRRKTEPKKAA